MSTTKKYLVRTGLDYELDGEPVRREPGDTLTAADLPKGADIGHLVKRGHLEEVKPKKAAAKKAVS